MLGLPNCPLTGGGPGSGFPDLPNCFTPGIESDSSPTPHALEVARRALIEIATATAWPARYSGPASAMQARAREALEEIERIQSSKEPA
jgi:hypothetical protein